MIDAPLAARRVRRRIRMMAGLCILGAALHAPVDGGDGTPRGPRIRFDELTHDFGVLRSDRPVEHRWVYRNVGDAPLRITGTRPQCGCTATTLDERDVPPGGSGTLHVTFDPAGMDGSVRKSLAVLSNDATRGTVLLTLRAVVEPVETERADGAHPATAGRSLLSGECASCHADPAAGRTGAELFAAVCAMCHGPRGGGAAHGPVIGTEVFLGSRSDEQLRTAVAYGTADPRMPGFSNVMGGPLDDRQVDSLVRVLRSWASDRAKPDPSAN